MSSFSSRHEASGNRHLRLEMVPTSSYIAAEGHSLLIEHHLGSHLQLRHAVLVLHLARSIDKRHTCRHAAASQAFVLVIIL
jgi:hypothetical protein